MNVNSIGSVAADQMIRRATAKAQELNVDVCIAVVDAGAHMQAFSRMDGAILGAVDVAWRKARTSILFQGDSGAFGEMMTEQGLLGMELSNGGLAGFPGGIPLRDGQDLIGAIGVSGASAEQDRAIARFAAGLE